MLNRHVPRKYRDSLHPPLTVTARCDNPYKLTSAHRAIRRGIGMTVHSIPCLQSPRITFVFAFDDVTIGAHLYDALLSSYHIDLNCLDVDALLSRSIDQLTHDLCDHRHYMLPMIDSIRNRTYDYDLSLTTAMLHVLNHATFALDNDDITLVCPTLVSHLYPDDVSPD